MKLIFDKTAEGEITVKMAPGAVAENFQYTKMVKYLLNNEEFSDITFKNLTTDEEARIQEMIDEIYEAVQENPDEKDGEEEEEEEE